MYHYRAFNLRLSSEIELPLVLRPPEHPDVVMRLMRPDTQAGPPVQMDWSYHVTPRFATLDYIDLGTLTIIEGREIRITLQPGANPELLPSYLMGTAMAVLLYQRGLIVLQASTVVMAGKAVTFMSESGGGKSLLAAVLRRRGHTLLADSFTAITLQQGQPLALPAFPQLQLSAEAAKAIGEDVAEFTPSSARDDKLALPIDEHFSGQLVPLTQIFQLHTGLDNNITYLNLQAGLATVIHNSYPNCLLQPGGIDYLRQCSRLVGAVAICQLTRRYNLADLQEQAQMVEGLVLAPRANARGRLQQ